jgi:hypothetical protein
MLTALLVGTPAAAQLQNVWLRAGVVRSTRLVEDEIASGTLRTQLGPGFTGAARVTPTVGIAGAAVYEMPLRAGVALEAVLGFSHAQLNATDAEGSRNLHSLNALHGTLGFRSDVTRAVHLSAGLGALRYFTARRGIFAAGSELSPLAEAGAGAQGRIGGKHVQLRALIQAHRFGTPALRRVDAQSGGVLRFSVQAGFAPWRRQ